MLTHVKCCENVNEGTMNSGGRISTAGSCSKMILYHEAEETHDNYFLMEESMYILR